METLGNCYWGLRRVSWARRFGGKWTASAARKLKTERKLEEWRKHGEKTNENMQLNIYFHNISLALFWSHSAHTHTQRDTVACGRQRANDAHAAHTSKSWAPCPALPPSSLTWHLSRQSQTKHNCLMHFDTLYGDKTTLNEQSQPVHELTLRSWGRSPACLPGRSLWSLGRSFIMRHISCNLCQVSLICFSFFAFGLKWKIAAQKVPERRREGARVTFVFAYYAYAAWVIKMLKGHMHSEKCWEM